MKQIIHYLFSFYLVVGVLGCDYQVDYEDFIKAEQQINEKHKELFKYSREISNDMRELMKRHPEKRIKLDTGIGLSEEQEEVILDMIKNEEDPSLKGTLQKIVEKNEKIDDLTQSIRRLEETLPTHYVVKKGDSHRAISINYLMNTHGLNKKAATKLVSRVAMIDELEVKFKVWFYYNDGVFGTFVTQGDARIGPYRLRRIMTKAKQDDIYREAYMRGREDALAGEPIPETLRGSDLSP